MVEVFQITPDQLDWMLGPVPNKHLAMFAARRSAEVFAGTYQGIPLGFVGFAPPTLISESAYVWLIDTEAAKAHKFILARYSRGVIEGGLLKYTRLYGTCFTPNSIRWLKWLGAEFTSPTEFEIRRNS